MYNAGQIGMFFVFIVFILISTMGYMIYGDKISPNYLVTISDTEIGITLYLIL